MLVVRAFVSVQPDLVLVPCAGRHPGFADERVQGPADAGAVAMGVGLAADADELSGGVAPAEPVLAMASARDGRAVGGPEP